MENGSEVKQRLQQIPDFSIRLRRASTSGAAFNDQQNVSEVNQHLNRVRNRKRNTRTLVLGTFAEILVPTKKKGSKSKSMGRYIGRA